MAYEVESYQFMYDLDNEKPKIVLRYFNDDGQPRYASCSPSPENAIFLCWFAKKRRTSLLLQKAKAYFYIKRRSWWRRNMNNIPKCYCSLIFFFMIWFYNELLFPKRCIYRHVFLQNSPFLKCKWKEIDVDCSML